MTSQEIQTNAITFLGKMMTDPQVLADVQNLPDRNDASAVGDLLAKHLNIPKPTSDEVQQMAQHIQNASQGVNDALSQHAPALQKKIAPNMVF